MYGIHGSVVERQLSIRGGARVQAQANSIYWNLGILHDKMNMRACAADFSLLNLPKGKSLGRSKPATNS